MQLVLFGSSRSNLLHVPLYFSWSAPAEHDWVKAVAWTVVMLVTSLTQHPGKRRVLCSLLCVSPRCEGGVQQEHSNSKARTSSLCASPSASKPVSLQVCSHRLSAQCLKSSVRLPVCIRIMHLASAGQYKWFTVEKKTVITRMASSYWQLPPCKCGHLPPGSA